MAQKEQTRLFQDNRVVWATAYDVGYKDKVQPYLKSLEINGIPCTRYAIDFIEPGTIRLDSRYFKAKADIQCIQHGEFLCKLQGNPTIVFTDGDIKCQRSLGEFEITMLDEWEDGMVGVTYNNGPGDSLLQEGLRLQPTQDLENIFKKFIWNRHPMYMPCYNTGVIVCKKDTYTRIYDAYCQLYPVVKECFVGYAKQQWLLSYLFETMKDLRVELLPDDFHVHGCFNTVRPVPDYYSYVDGDVYIYGTRALLQHNWMTPTFTPVRFL